MYRQHYLPTTGRSAVAATRRPGAAHARGRRRRRARAAARHPEPGTRRPGRRPGGPARPTARGRADQRLAGAAPPTGSGPTDDLLNLRLVHRRARRAARRRRRARPGHAPVSPAGALSGRGKAGDYYLAGPQGVSHQPLRELFAPLAAWLAAPGHEHEMVRLGLPTDPRSANPAPSMPPARPSPRPRPVPAQGERPAQRQDAGRADAGRVAALRGPAAGNHRLVGLHREEPPLARPPARRPRRPPSRTMDGRSKAIIGQRPLRQVVIPGSHDAATYEDSSCPVAIGP